TKRADDGPRRGSAFEALKALFASTDRVFEHLSYWKRLAVMIEQADLALRPAELFYLQLGGALLGGLVGAVIGGPGFLALLCAVAGGALPFLFVRRTAAKRRRTFESQLPDVLVSVAASLRAGHSFAQ